MIELNAINTLLINLIILLFPLVIYLFYCAHSKNMNKEESNTILDFSLLSSLYLFYTHCKIESTMNFIIMLNIPLIIAFIKKRIFVSVIISILIIYIYRLNINIPIIALIIEYTVYYITYYLVNKYNKENLKLILFMIIKSIFKISYIFLLMPLEIENIISNLVILICFIILTNLILYIFNVGEDIIKLHMTIKELEQEKQIRDSLFKITHEIKNPIAVCKTYLDMFDFSNKEHEKFIPIIKEEIDKTLLLLQDFLAMNKIKVKKEILDINLLLEDVTRQFETVTKSQNINFRYDISEEEIFIEGDYNRLSQVLINIIKNSIEAIDINKIPEIILSTRLLDDKIEIVIYDNGIGIEEEHLTKMKEPFYTTKKNGTGLGVPLSCEIIEAHNGTIKFSSKIFEWTKVIITIPIINIPD